MKHPIKALPLRACARLTLSALALSAASTSLADTSETFDTMTVTANRMPTENALAPTTVITRTDIERLQINDLPTLLSRQPGIDMGFKGGMGKDTSIFLRGTSSRHVLFLVDGIKWQSATLGESAIQDFPVEQIERIEIVRGPRSGLYGSEAIGGVIQIFTRKGQKGLKPFAKVAYGSDNTKQGAVGLSGGNDLTTYNLSVNYQSTDGISALEESNPDEDGYRNKSVSAKVEHQLTDTVTVGANFFRAEGDNETDRPLGFFVAPQDRFTSEVTQQVLGTHLNWQVTDAWQLKTQLGESRDQSEEFTNSTTESVFDTRHRFANITSTYKLSENHTVNLGLDYDHDHIDSIGEYLETSRDNKAAFLSWQGKAGNHSWLLSGRHDDNEAFGTKNTGTAEWGYWLNDSLQLTAGYGTAFKAPTFNDLYYPEDPYGVGNPGLEPEESRTWSAGLNGGTHVTNWSVNLFKTKVENLIQWAPVDSAFPFGQWTPSNVSEAEIKGIEFEFSTRIFEMDIAFDASFLRPEDADTDKTLIRRAKRYANLHIDRQWAQWSAGASWKLSGHRYEDADNLERLDGYGLLDLRVAYQFDPDWTAKLSVSNALDKDYETVSAFNSLDRTVMFTLIYQP